ncbi:RNA-binding S4 domain-containing protein [Robiginitalea aurantiaca]|uniref:S4 domain-containing protein n=1 Tax=Robiginitalea aurantiaca TaxID=3056915 RepID=A0ABT7WIB2_9FLAO|nr:S4 domain-containing protein [Robiginitalea aurantiaca]MDM9632655.1 S4 domain-containing protein [Robiginitalea aurantiaca]
MRIDKYLWCTRYFKTRNQATEACKKGHVRIGEQVVKPSREILPTDEILVRKNQINYRLKVLDIPTQRLGAKLVDIYRMDTTPAEALDHLKTIQTTREYYRKKGTGRPTKKDRRELDDYRDEAE